MKILAINGHTAHCSSRGIERKVNCFMLQDPPVTVGDYVMVHVGYAIQKVETAHAELAWEIDNALTAGGDTDA